ncbi:MAG: GNAT family N-acetyltransferase [Candidatus Hermodarchaeota archaeon]
MVVQIPQNELKDFLPFFKDHRYLKNAIRAVPSLSIAKGFTDDLEKPRVVLFIIDWLGFLAGEPNSPQAEDILSEIPERTAVLISNEDWVPLMSQKWGRVGRRTRFAFSTESLDIEHIRTFLQSPPKGFSLHKVDMTIAQLLDTDTWFHITKYFGGLENFAEKGLGFAMIDDLESKIVTLASSFYPYSESLEIDITTIDKYRRRGFATIACAKLIEYCLEKGIEPHWDAANEHSVQLALKLGYTNPEPYTLYGWLREWAETNE